MTHRHAAHDGTLRHWIMYDDVQTTCPESLKSTYVLILRFRQNYEVGLCLIPDSSVLSRELSLTLLLSHFLSFFVQTWNNYGIKDYLI